MFSESLSDSGKAFFTREDDAGTAVGILEGELMSVISTVSECAPQTGSNWGKEIRGGQKSFSETDKRYTLAPNTTTGQ
jgi:hypothetical protein